MSGSQAIGHDGFKVVHSCTSTSFSGLESYVLDLAAWQHRQGKSVELFCREGCELETRARDQGVPVWTISSSTRSGPLQWVSLRNQWRARLQAGPVVLHMHASGEPWFHFPWLLRHSFAKAVFHYHIWMNHRKTDLFHRLLFSLIDEVWTSSESARAHFLTLLPVDRSKIRVMAYGRDVKLLTGLPKEQFRREERAKLGLKESDVLAACVSRFERIKGVGELFDAFTSVARRMPNAHLVLVGGVSPNNAEAEKFGLELDERYRRLEPQVRSRLHRPGWISPCWPILAAADFYVLPSYEECMSLAMLDAAVLGLPILGTNSGGTPSIARPDETGMLVPPANVEALSKGLEKLFEDAGLRSRLGLGASQLANEVDQEQVFERIWQSYQVCQETKVF